MKVDSDFERSIKLLIMGDSAVGKSNYIFRFINNQFSDTHFATVGFDVRAQIIQIDNSKIRVQIWDTAGQERYRSLSKNLFTRAQGIILMYDITSRDSFNNVEGWLTFIRESCAELPILLLGNKVDMVTQRQVEKEEGERYSLENKISFFEVSAKEAINIRESITSIAKDILNHRKKKDVVSFNLEKNQSKSFCCGN